MEYNNYENLDLEHMPLEEIVKLEKQYLVEVLHKDLIDSDERDDVNFRGHRYLAYKYWTDEFRDGIKKCVHHIDFNHSNNVVSNLVVLTVKEHKIVHYLFDPSYVEVRQRIRQNNKNYWSEERRKEHGKLNSGKKNGMYNKEPWNKGKKSSEETKAKLREAWKKRKSIPVSEETKQKISIKSKEYWRKKKEGLL